MDWGYQPPKMGDIIRVKVQFYHHYGLYVDDNTIIQFGLPDNTGIDPKEIKVMITTLQEWLPYGTPESAILTKEEKKTRRSSAEAVRIAQSRLGEGGYNILHNNCEHFVNDCVFGEKKSNFLDDVRQKIRLKMK